MKKIIYIINNPYDAPSAAFNRISLFEKGLTERNYHVIIDKLTPTYKVPRILRKFFIVYNCISYYLHYFLNKDNYIIIYGDNYLWHLLPFKRKAKVLVERNEYPTFMIESGNKSGKNSLTLLKTCDGFITCTNALKDFYSNYLNIKDNICISQVIVDTKKFELSIPKGKYITYCGDWGNHKDGVDILINAFAIFHKYYPNYRLRLIGGSTKEVETSLHNLADHLNIESYIDYIGRIQHKQIPEYLCSSSILALSRPNNKQAEGGFPSKVAEYLSTGIPVVLTNVGELHTILKDGYNCYMSKPDSAELFAEKLIQAVMDKNSIEIGTNGKITAATFNYDIQTKQLLEYIESL